MGVTFTCPLADVDDMDSHYEAVILKSISFKDEDVKKALRSVSFNGRIPDLASYDSRKLMLDKSLSFNRKEMENMPSYKTPCQDEVNKMSIGLDSVKNENNSSSILQRSNSLAEKKSHLQQRYQAALKLQKVYKSFRTRRQLADCAVVVEQRWWKLLDFAELKRSSISFFEIEKPETAISKWSRASKRAAKVGQGLSKDKKARKLALQHWLEAIDPRHRYGHNLQFYYAEWIHCDSQQPFFYWLDVGEGKEVNLEKCSRAKLHQQCIKYLGPTEREAYEVIIENGKFIYKQNGTLLHTTEGSKDAKWIFVLSAFKILYVGQKIKGTFQHSSFLAGGATLSAGRLVVENGVLKVVWPHSGHYLPTHENFLEFMSFLREHNVDITNVKTNPSEEEETISRKNSTIRSNTTEAEGFLQSEVTDNKNTAEENTVSRNIGSDAAENELEVPAREDGFDTLEMETLPPSCNHEQPESSLTDDGYETAEEFLSDEEFMVTKVNLFGEEDDEQDDKQVPKEKIMQRIDSHKGMKSYQLAQQLSSKWSTGAGPRISCMRDYPSELQFLVLEHANLSPKAANDYASPRTTSRFSPKASSDKESSSGRSSVASLN